MSLFSIKKEDTVLKVSSIVHLYSKITQHLNRFPLSFEQTPCPKKLWSIKPNQLKFSRCMTVIITQQHVTFPLSLLRISRAQEVQSHTAVTRHSVSRVLWKPFCLPPTLLGCQTISAAAPLCFVPPAKASYMARLEVSVFTARHTLLCDIEPRGL